MSFPVACTACSAKFNMSARLWNERVAGRVAVIHCRKCRAPIELDGTRSLSPVAGEEKVVPAPKPSSTPSPSISPEVRATAKVEVPKATVPRPANVATVPRPASVAQKAAAPRPSVASKPAVEREPSVAPKVTVPRPASVAPKPAVEREPSVVQKAAAPRPASVAHKPSAENEPSALVRPVVASEPSALVKPASVAAKPSATKSASGAPAPVAAGDRLVVRESPPVPSDSAPSLRALEVSRKPTSSPEVELAEDEELADEVGSERTPSGILVDRTVVARRRSTRQRPSGLAPAAIVATLGAALWWQVSGIGPAAAPAPTQAAAAAVDAVQREPEPSALLEPAPVAEPALSKPERESAPESARSLVAEPAPAVINSAPEPVAYDTERLDLAVRWARAQAERCHLGGRAVGTAELTITFSPEGKVAALQLTGEPIASAPVAHCVTSYFRSMLIPPFEGEAFTIHESLTLR